ncbi:ubiquitin C-terminal hydrolase 12-like [Telopea speciosissima]|uniref:ubiquitin C-terminal hydrolase 12-like n=1 Tax=Telopea speciosissima TaxID=54955 RepID=UPI001CC4F41B|nr:ubiquitin C-terminal hydrolase 12-like [Telopea speciosissima]
MEQIRSRRSRDKAEETEKELPAEVVVAGEGSRGRSRELDASLEQEQEDAAMLVPHSSFADGPQQMEVVARAGTSITVENQPVKEKFRWKIEDFSSLNFDEEHYSDIFAGGGFLWRMLIVKDRSFLSMYLEVADSVILPYKWSICAQFSLALICIEDEKKTFAYLGKDVVLDEICVSDSFTLSESETDHQFKARASRHGFRRFILTGQLYNRDTGYIVEDTLIVEAKVAVKAVYDSKKETGYVGLKEKRGTRYMNSLLQTLYHIPCFRKVVYQIPTTENDMQSECTPLALQSLFYRVQNGDNSVAMKELRKYFVFKKHDVLEFNSVLFQMLEDKMKGTVVEGSVRRLFEGHYVDKCMNEVSFYGIRLDVKGCRDVFASIDKFVKDECLEDSNKACDEQRGLQRIDHYEYPLHLNLGKYLSHKNQGVDDIYTLHSVLVHGFLWERGPHYALIRPTLSDQWCFKFDDERVTKADMKMALEEQYGGMEQTKSDSRYTPFDSIMHTIAYMLVYIRERDKEKIFCDMDEKDIAKNIRLGHSLWKREQEKKEQEKKEKAEADCITIIKVAKDEDLREQIGRDIYFDLVDHDKLLSFSILKVMPFIDFKEYVAKEFRIPVMFQRFWLWAKRKNNTYRPSRPLTSQEEQLSVGRLRELSSKEHNAELKLFLEVVPNQYILDAILLFFKLYDPEKEELRYVGSLFVYGSDRPVDILTELNDMAGFGAKEEIELYEEVEFKPRVKCEHINKELTFQSKQIIDGDIICFQKSSALKSSKQYQYPDVPSFLKYVGSSQKVYFRRLKKPEEDCFLLVLASFCTYDNIVKKVAVKLCSVDPSKIRLTSHNCLNHRPYPQPIVYSAVECLAEMLFCGEQISNILYYEVLDTLPKLIGLHTRAVALHSPLKDEPISTDVEKLRSQRNEFYVSLFLTSLDHTLKGHLLAGETIPTLNENFSRLQRMGHSAKSKSLSKDNSAFSDGCGRGRSYGGGCGSGGHSNAGQQGDHPPRQCSYCGKPNHTIDTCWAKHGKPEWAKQLANHAYFDDGSDTIPPSDSKSGPPTSDGSTSNLHDEDLHTRKTISGGREKDGLYYLSSAAPTASTATTTVDGVSAFQWHYRNCRAYLATLKKKSDETPKEGIQSDKKIG